MESKCSKKDQLSNILSEINDLHQELSHAGSVLEKQENFKMCFDALECQKQEHSRLMEKFFECKDDAEKESLKDEMEKSLEYMSFLKIHLNTFTQDKFTFDSNSAKELSSRAKQRIVETSGGIRVRSEDYLLKRNNLVPDEQEQIISSLATSVKWMIELYEELEDKLCNRYLK